MFGFFKGLKTPLLEFSGALFQLTYFWLFPGPETETDGIDLFKGKEFIFILFV
jgi:hypothetical protein